LKMSGYPDRTMFLGRDLHVKSVVDTDDLLVMPGWFCRDESCRVFNGEMKRKRDECRACGTKKS
jgi:hypothetical protein